MAVPLSRIQALTKLRCKIYGHSYNPSNARTGAKILRQRLRGPALAAYYPPRPVTNADLRFLMSGDPDLEFFDEEEEERLDDLALLKAKGKGPPKKKRTAEESKKFSKKRGAAKPAPAAPAAPPA